LLTISTSKSSSLASLLPFGASNNKSIRSVA
jgi:hypothetical protein